MPKRPGLSRREKELLDIIYSLGEATAADVQEAMPSETSNAAVRTFLRNLETKGYLEHRKIGRKFVYSPKESGYRAGVSAMKHIMNTFFGGSVEKAVSAMIHEDEIQMDEATYEKLSALIAEKRGGGGDHG